MFQQAEAVDFRGATWSGEIVQGFGFTPDLHAGSESSRVQTGVAVRARPGFWLAAKSSGELIEAGLVEVESGEARSSSTDLWVDQA
jgi:hypothetical protein